MKRLFVETYWEWNHDHCCDGDCTPILVQKEGVVFWRVIVVTFLSVIIGVIGLIIPKLEELWK